MGKEIPEIDKDDHIDNDDYILESIKDFIHDWEDEIYSASREEVVEALCFHLKGMRDNVFGIFEEYI